MVEFTKSFNVFKFTAFFLLTLLSGQTSLLYSQESEAITSAPIRDEVKQNLSVNSDHKENSTSIENDATVNQVSQRIPVEGNLKSLSALNEETELQFVDTPLVDALNIIGELYEITLYPDVNAMLEAGVELDEPVNIFISGVRLRDGLDLILLPLGLDYVVDEGVVKVTTKAVADQKLKIEIHTNTNSPQEDPEELIELITSLVEPNTWTQSGGRGVIKPYKGDLVILQTQRNHHIISTFIAALKQVE